MSSSKKYQTFVDIEIIFEVLDAGSISSLKLIFSQCSGCLNVAWCWEIED